MHQNKKVIGTVDGPVARGVETTRCKCGREEGYSKNPDVGKKLVKLWGQFAGQIERTKWNPSVPRPSINP